MRYKKSNPKLSGLSSFAPLPKDQRLVIDTFYRTFNTQNLDLLDQIVTADWENVPLFPGQRQGREGFKEVIRIFIKAFPDLQVSIQGTANSQRRARVRARITFTHVNYFMGLPPTGSKANIIVEDFHTIKNGKITYTQHMEDWYSLIKSTGSLPISVPSKRKKRGRYPGRDI